MTENRQGVYPLIRKRKSIVSFSEQEIRDDTVKLLFEAASLAPSSYNAQPWRFIMARKGREEEYDIFVNLLNEGNRVWAVHAPLLILSIAEIQSHGRTQPNAYAMHDLGMAEAALMYQAVSMDLYVHPMGGYDSEKAVEMLGIPANFRPGVMMAVGYRGEIDHLPVELKRRELARRQRKSRDEFVFTGKFGAGV